MSSYINDMLNSMNDCKISNNSTYDLHLNIVRSSLRGKSVELLPGVNEFILYKFNLAGCNLIENVVGYYLLFDKDDDVMDSWLESEIHIYDKRIRIMICNCINEWVYYNL